MIAQDVAKQLRRVGAVVIGPAPSVRRALRLLDDEPPIDAAVLDVNLGEENSFPVARLLREQGTPFLFSTGYNSADIPAEWTDTAISVKPLRLAAVGELLSIGQGS